MLQEAVFANVEKHLEGTPMRILQKRIVAGTMKFSILAPKKIPDSTHKQKRDSQITPQDWQHCNQRRKEECHLYYALDSPIIHIPLLGIILVYILVPEQICIVCSNESGGAILLQRVIIYQINLQKKADCTQ